jgi:hypothetical protein
MSTQPEQFPSGTTSHIAGVGRVRRLGHFPGPNAPAEPPLGPVDGRTDPTSPEDALAELSALRSVQKRSQALIALALIMAGVLFMSVGIAFTFGWTWGLTTLGAWTLVVGGLFAFKS